MLKPADSSKREDRGLRARLALVVAVAWSAYTLAYLCHLFFYLGIVVYPLTHRAISAGLVCILTLLLVPWRKSGPPSGLKWYDWLPILVVALGCGYIGLHANKLIAEGRLMAHPWEMILATLFFLSVIEATRRTTGWILAGLVIASFFYAVYSDHFPGFLRSTGFPFSMALGWMYLSGEGVWGMILGVVAEIVAGFIIFGGFLKAVGASKFFNDLALALAGSMRGGAAKAAVIASTFFGTISGSIAANVATTGQITIPLMKNTGYKPDYAGAVEATASTGGMFMPPIMGATAFLIAEFLQISYWDVCVAAFLPGIAYYATLLIQVDLQAAKIGLKGLPRDQLPSIGKTLKEGWQYLLPFALLIFLLAIMRYSAQTSIIYTLGALVVISAFNNRSRLTLKRLIEALDESAKGMMPIIPLCTAIGILVGAVEITGSGTKFTSQILTISGGNLFLLLLMTAAAAFILGMGMTTVSVYILTVVLLAPALVRAGVEPIAAHLFLFYFGCLSFITPPVAVAAYIAAGISHGSPWATGFQAVRLGFAAFLVPWAFVFNPGILMIGSPLKVLITSFFVILGTMSIGVAFEGYFLKRLKTWENMMTALGGFLIFFPSTKTRATGLAILLLLAAKQIMQEKRKAVEIDIDA
jgi:TRAP transporter 4TM/12TM fusion protein